MTAAPETKTKTKAIRHQAIAAYADAFGQLTEASLDDLVAMVSDDIVFTDPFNRIEGRSGFRHVFIHMYDTCHDPRFEISDLAHGKDASYIRWRMTARLKSWPRMALDFTGMTEVHANDEGQITAHYDHWDSASQLLAKIPYIGAVIRPILRQFVLPNHH
jgi:ketosteroid isomerase-like protein